MAGTAHVTDDVSVLFSNDAFYIAFATRDVDAMVSVWSDRDGLTCIHPGWAPLLGRRAVLGSWRAILGNPGAPQISCNHARATIIGEVAYVVCYERIDASTSLVATNVFVREDGVWKMVHHQAGAGPAPDDDEPEEETPLQ
jgi:ketosteroid isomerase-like protein